MATSSKRSILPLNTDVYCTETTEWISETFLFTERTVRTDVAKNEQRKWLRDRCF